MAELTPLWDSVDQTLRAPGPFTVAISKWHPGKQYAYSACEHHYVAWNDFWISDTPFASQAAAIEAMERFAQGIR